MMMTSQIFFEGLVGLRNLLCSLTSFLMITPTINLTSLLHRGNSKMTCKPPPEHGTVARYNQPHRCRCGDCVQANRDYHAAYRSLTPTLAVSEDQPQIMKSSTAPFRLLLRGVQMPAMSASGGSLCGETLAAPTSPPKPQGRPLKKFVLIMEVRVEKCRYDHNTHKHRKECRAVMNFF